MLKRNKTIVALLSIVMSISFVNASVAFASDEQTGHIKTTDSSGNSSELTYHYFDTVTTSTDEASIINAINSRGTKTVIVNVNTSNNTGTIANTPLISENILESLKANTEKTLVINSETVYLEINATSDGEIKFTRNKAPIVGFITIGNANYYLNSNGIMQTGWVESPGKTWYHFNQATGAKDTNWLMDTNYRWYYLDPTSGVMKTGWLNDNGKWYYLNSYGEMVTNTKVDGYNIDINGVYVK